MEEFFIFFRENFKKNHPFHMKMTELPLGEKLNGEKLTMLETRNGFCNKISFDKDGSFKI